MEKKGGAEYQDSTSKMFCLTLPKHSVGKSFSVALISGIEKVEIKGGMSIKIFCPNFFLSHSAEKFRRGILYCCNNFGQRKSLEKRGGGGVSRFYVEIFWSHSAEKFLGEHFRVSLVSGIEEVWIRGGYQDFLSKVFCLTLPKFSVGEPFSVSLVSGIEKFFASEGYVTISDFLSNSFVSQCRKYSQATLLCCVSENFR